MSIENPKIPGISDPRIDTQMEQKELLRNALQESYELNLINSNDNETKIKNIERIQEEKGLSLDSEIFQRAFNTTLKKGDSYAAFFIDSLAKGKELKLTPQAENLQLGYEKLMEQGENGKAEDIEKIAQEKNIELTANKEAMQKGYDYGLEHSYSWIIKNMEKFADKKGIKLDVKEEVLQKAYNKYLVERMEFLRGIIEIEQFAKQNSVQLEVDGEAIQKGYENYIENRISGDIPEEWLENVKNIEKFASKKGVELKIEKNKLQDLLEKGLIRGDDRIITGTSALARKKNIDLDISELDLQKLFNESFSEGYLRPAKIIKRFAKENNLEMQTPTNKEIQQYADTILASGNFYGFTEIKKFAEENGVEVDIKKDIFQKCYEVLCTGNVEHVDFNGIYELENMADEYEIKIEHAKELTEKTYIEAIHNVNLGHAAGERRQLKEKLEKLGSDLTYEKVIKMDYLDYLEVPEEQRLKIEKNVAIGNASITARFYGQKGEVPVKGKFIIGITPENTLEFVADSTLGEHRDIAGKFDLEIIGGGWLEIDEQNKKVKIYRSSQDFGYEPRSISKQVVSEVFSECEVIVEN